ncbi:contact-dependent growth inhibition system immunity protein [Amycolatopsis roodepoortensis]|uniref:CdiI immunity protein domain-containing protein n=1 Tax=Amycolatopsis roodepoortensis TaxID=700274 RepID=A0ABR9LAK4_9PSEU|nr:contact-dependent growth inhibition system immunity protein [Amycolatopsis roodepoortensis]MBE1577703.1 hypothetical protein [Amycolatopsis roodepoortensis]
MLGYLATYFHQDYDLEAGSPIGVVKKFTDDELVEYSRELLVELETLKAAGLTEGQARKLWRDDYNAMYEPDIDGGISYLEWFDQIRAEVKSRLDREQRA